MTTTLLADLREPPVVGRFYMVPCITYPYHERVDVWPTLGPLHHDRGEVNFPYLHYHIDPRFLTADQARHCARKSAFYGGTVEACAAAYPLSHHGSPLPARPHLVRRKCRASSWQYSPPSAVPWLDALEARYGAPADPIRVKRDRLLCPHRKVDLSSLQPDADGIVTCPLHGLRVRCAAASHPVEGTAA